MNYIIYSYSISYSIVAMRENNQSKYVNYVLKHPSTFRLLRGRAECATLCLYV